MVIRLHYYAKDPLWNEFSEQVSIEQGEGEVERLRLEQAEIMTVYPIESCPFKMYPKIFFSNQYKKINFSLYGFALP